MTAVVTSPRTARFVAVEFAVWAVVYGSYLMLRSAAIARPDEALKHAHAVVGLEQTLGLFQGARIQHASDTVAGLLSAYLLISIAIASVVYVAYPVAPPRLADLGIAGTVGLSAHDTGSFMGIRFDPYAAMPSMHVGWSLLLGRYGVLAAPPRIVRTFFFIHPAVMVLAVTATGNHYVLDSIAGAAVAGIAFALVRLASRLSVRRQLTNLSDRQSLISDGSTVR